jgi:phage shock protein PspC (stress-responsive transcriptional regulator)
MKKTTNINLGGLPFVIDEDAYGSLERYLETIRRHFSYSEGCEEILEDIEIRIAEIFESKQGGRHIISMKEIKEVIDIMGKPQDFGAETMYEESFNSTNTTTEEQYEYRTGKKLYRDVDRKIFGGVCSGFAAYFGIQNLFIFRLIVAILAWSGIGLFLYFVLWLVLPPAVTVADKLEMKGEPVNVSNIAKKVEQEISDIGKMITDLGKDLKNRKK